MGFEEAITRHTTRAPTAMHDEIVNIVTTSKALEELTLRMYRNREKPNKINQSLILHQVQQEGLWEKN